MADSLQHVAPGDPLSISADTWNLLLDAARVLRRDGPRALGRGQSTEELWRPAVVVLVANGSGASRQPGEVLTPTAAAVEPTSDEHGARRRPALSGETPATEDDAVLVLLDGAATGAVVRAVAAGVTVANVQVTDTAHRYARAVPGDATKLVSADSGPAYLLVPPDATGTALRYVLLGAPVVEPTAAGLTGAFTDRVGPGYTITADNVWQDTGITTTLPGAGTYLLEGWSDAVGQVSALAAGQSGAIMAQIYDVTAGAAINPSQTFALAVQVTGRSVRQSFAIRCLYTASGANTLRVEAQRVGFGTTWTTSIIGNGLARLSGLGYLRL